MLSTDEMLEGAAEDGSMDLAKWPRVLESLLQRLHDIVYNEFPIPSLPPPPPPARTSVDLDPAVVASTPPPLPPSDTNTNASLPEADSSELPTTSQSSVVENDAPADIAAGRPPDARGSETSESEAMAPPPLAPPETQQGALPPELLSLYQQSTDILQYDFAKSPPYTIQRLAELALRPKKHYRFLPAYLRALDRIVSVSSPVSDFPLPALHTPIHAGFLTNGEAPVNGTGERGGLGSDESLGGALLTPIPWLRDAPDAPTPTPAAPESQGEWHSESTHTIQGPHGAGSIETVTVTVNGVSSVTTTPPSPSSPLASPAPGEQSDARRAPSASADAQPREPGGVTQGELLRQEQEARVVPVSSAGQAMTPRVRVHAGGAGAGGGGGLAAAASAMDQAGGGREEDVHARGPDVIGMEDTGPQPASPPAGTGHVLDMQAAVGRGRSKSPQPPPSESAARDAMEGVEPAGSPGRDVESEVAELKRAMDAEPHAAAPPGDHHVVVAVADAGDTEMKEAASDDERPDAGDSTTL